MKSNENYEALYGVFVLDAKNYYYNEDGTLWYMAQLKNGRAVYGEYGDGKELSKDDYDRLYRGHKAYCGKID